ncbi:MAG: glyceraldehyde 3-phosphate dehydrogenase NAD-binding domain-containing protein [Candidatus Cloacimonadales bacterium]|jgi:glyceraldehyde 3-phosphate dehydrogenase|nr:glyceraldehyde-3-phosphate dehydrogenase [Candidatus Cloacimonadota bacterium]MDD2649555.1 glyceraldehyde 3-phosphate dehydrogenase NAD-binding domain-containing protein [Candidatus Cloacimonadota bacterium]MDD3501504.1 glyceraldehyde 3-phosphate dehydrogenase NAD-binding domain-containing protein [Candidatus Cloacimonadota bacterium]MDX9977424.1 glyceraldehyde 3-phosphate dehydrogenase NAD-binding domain-containing protein [Candidatus Cloacimonadales bacterium]
MKNPLGKKTLGINSLGRIGKLTLWNHLQMNYFDSFVINCGREVGKKLDDLIQVIETDSTYGSIHRFLRGYNNQKVEIKVLDEKEQLLSVDGKKVKILRTARNPKDINWANEGVRLVVECSGTFNDPTAPVDAGKGALRGHIEAGAEKVILSAPFKIAEAGKGFPDDSGMFVYGINHLDYNPAKHNVLSAASCTTTGLAHMMKPLLDDEYASDIITASMSTIHAMTNSQSTLDSVPKTGASDLRKSRGITNNIILSTTGAAKALGHVMPAINNIGFLADSVRIPTATVSLIVLNITFRNYVTENEKVIIDRDYINNLYQKASEGIQKDLLVYSERQNVSTDLMGEPAACVIEGRETHTRTGFLKTACKHDLKEGETSPEIPVTHAKLFAWYDNELGSYVYSLGKLTKYVYERM